MIDFTINDRGDIIFSQPIKTDKLKVGFRISNNNGLMVKFITSDINEPTSSQLKINFVQKNIDSEKSKANIVTENNQKLQSIRLALQTELKQLKHRSSFGSTLYLIKHENLYDSTNIKLIETEVGKAIKHIIQDAKVIAKPEKGIGNFYSQNVGVYIYHEELLIFKFYI